MKTSIKLIIISSLLVASVAQVQENNVQINLGAVYTSNGKAYLHSSLNKIESRLNTNDYFKVSLADVIGLDAIKQIEQNINYGYTAQLSDNNNVEISRRQASKLKTKLSFLAF